MKKPNIQYIAAKALIRNHEGKVLVLKQSDPTISGNNKYHPPGGIVEPGETLKECVVREVREETGMNAEVIGLFDVGEWSAERGDDAMQFVGVFYTCRSGDEVSKLQDSEVSEAVWVGPENIDALDIVEPSKSIIKKLLSIPLADV